MRLLSFTGPPGRGPRTGVLRADGVVDCTDLVGPGGWRTWFATGDAGRLAAHVDAAPTAAALADLTLLPPVPDPAKIICVGLNYRGHLLETGRPLPEHPTLFPRYADSQMGHGAPALIPAESTRFDYEGELAVVIGRPCRRVAAADAEHVIAGYAPYDDFSARDWQRHTSQFLPGKNFPGTGGFGPWLVTPDEAGDVTRCVLTTRVNGEVRQQAPLRDLMFGIPDLIAYISTFTPLQPGDVIVTGTPAGVGLYQDPPAFLQAGDEVSVEISGIGTLVNPVAPDTTP